MPEFCIRVAGDDLVFSACHFITFENGACEQLHGHDYRVAVEVRGPLNPSEYVIDFALLREVIKNIVAQFDHRVLIAQHHPRINIHTMGGELEIKIGGRRWVLPKDDCVLLGVANTTGEILARHIAVCIREELASRKIGHPKHILVELGEGKGFTSIYQLMGNE